MTISKQAIAKIDNATQLKLALALGYSGRWIVNVIAANKPNGPLTTYKALQVIRQETGLTDQQILEEEPVTEAQS